MVIQERGFSVLARISGPVVSPEIRCVPYLVRFEE
jgi:hypothetical protein